MWRRAVIGLAVVVLFVVTALPAMATVWKTGTQSCSVTVAYTNALASGSGEIGPPGSGYYTFSHGSTLKWSGKKYASTNGGGFWFVNSDAILSNSTYSACSQYVV